MKAPRRRPPRPRTPTALRLQILDRGRPRTPRRLLRAAVRATLEFAGRPELPVSLLLTDDAGIAELHGRFLGDPSPTDVMSFGLDDGAEVVVSVATASRVARAHGHAVAAEVVLYVVHGLLHVLGHDDDAPRARARMRAAERAILRQLGLEVAPVDARRSPRARRRRSRL
jgi:probable rRNA maturation factor